MEKELEKVIAEIQEQEKKPPKEYSKEKIMTLVKNASKLYGDLKKFEEQYQCVMRLLDYYSSQYPDRDPRLLPYYEKVIELTEMLPSIPNQNGQILIYKNKIVVAYQERNRELKDKQKDTSTGGESLRIDEALIANTYQQIAKLHIQIDNNYAKAIENLDLSIEHYTKKYSEEHQIIATILFQISKYYIELLNYEAAYTQGDKAFKMMKKTAGSDNRETALCVSNLARIQRLRDNFREAIDEERKALEIFEKYHRNKAHPDIADALFRLAELYETMSEYEKAFELQEKSLSMNRKLHGQENIQVANSILSIAKSLSHLQNHDSAVKYALASTIMLKKVSGNDSLEYARGMTELIDIYCAANHFKEAMENQKIVIDILRKQNQQLELVQMLCKFASTAEKFELYDLQIDSVKEALKHLKMISPEKDVKVSTLTHNLSHLLCYQGRIEEAIDYGYEALDQRIANFGENSTNVASTYEILTQAYIQKNDLVKAEEFMEEAIRIYSVLCEERGAHTEWARLLDCLADIQNKMDKSIAAIDSQKKSLDMIESLFSNEHPLYASGLINLSTYYLNTDKPEVALGIVLQGIHLLSKEYGDDDMNLSDPYEILSKIYVQLGQMGHATQFQFKSMEINKRFMGEKHQVVRQNMSNLAEIYQRQRRYKDSKRMNDKISILNSDIFSMSPQKLY